MVLRFNMLSTTLTDLSGESFPTSWCGSGSFLYPSPGTPEGRIPLRCTHGAQNHQAPVPGECCKRSRGGTPWQHASPGPKAVIAPGAELPTRQPFCMMPAQMVQVLHNQYITEKPCDPQSVVRLTSPSDQFSPAVPMSHRGGAWGDDVAASGSFRIRVQYQYWAGELGVYILASCRLFFFLPTFTEFAVVGRIGVAIRDSFSEFVSTTTAAGEWLFFFLTGLLVVRQRALHQRAAPHFPTAQWRFSGVSCAAQQWECCVTG